jgi:hypothetical protein
MNNRLIDDVNAFSGDHEPNDDQTLLLVRIN